MPLNPSVAIFGEVLVDVFPDQNVLGGAPYNVARHLQAFGIKTEIISRIGMDSLGDALMEEMMNLGLETHGIHFDPNYPTGQVKVQIQDGKHQFEILPDQAYDHISVTITQETMQSIQPSIAYFGTLALRGLESRLAAEQFLTDANCLKFLDLNLRTPWYTIDIIDFALTQAHIAKMNDEELAIIAQLFHLKGSPEQQAIALQKQFNLEQLLITCGEKGCWLLDSQSRIFKAVTIETPEKIIDTVGAGDAFSAVFILGNLYQWTIATTLERASAFASAICGVRGASAPAADFYRSFLQNWMIKPH